MNMRGKERGVGSKLRNRMRGIVYVSRAGTVRVTGGVAGSLCRRRGDFFEGWGAISLMTQDDLHQSPTCPLGGHNIVMQQNTIHSRKSVYTYRLVYPIAIYLIFNN